MADIHPEIKINAAPQAVYQALTSASELKKWHTARAESANDQDETRTMYPADGPAFTWKGASRAADTVEWECVAGPGNSVGTSARFQISPLDDGRTLVEFSHSDWPENDGNFRKCNTLWAVLLFHLKKYLGTRQAEPAFRSFAMQARVFDSSPDHEPGCPISRLLLARCGKYHVCHDRSPEGARPAPFPHLAKAGEIWGTQVRGREKTPTATHAVYELLFTADFTSW